MELQIFKKIKRMTSPKRDVMSIVEQYYGHLLTLISFLLLMYLSFVFAVYDYKTVHDIYAPDVSESLLKKDALKNIIAHMKERAEAPRGFPDTLKNPFAQ